MGKSKLAKIDFKLNRQRNDNTRQLIIITQKAFVKRVKYWLYYEK